MPCLEEEAHTYITYWWKRASMMEWHERWDDPANKLNTWDDTYEGWQIVTSSPFFSGFSRSHLNRVKQAVLQMNQSSNNCPKLLHLNAPVTFFMTCSQQKGHETCFFWIIQLSPNKLGFPKWHFQGLQSPQVVVNGQRDCRLSSWGELTSLEDLRAVLTSKCQEAKEKLPLSLRIEIGRLTPSHHSEGCRWLIESCDIHKKV